MEERIGHYSIVSELGRGGMGVVYKAHEQSLNRFVALKVLGEHLSEDPGYVERFKREARSAAALNHPNIVQIYAIDEFEGRHYFAMEFVNGTSIQQLIRSQGPMDVEAAARWIQQAAAGLGAAHSQGIIHRDVKPANLMVDEHGLVKIADFGLALLAAGTSRLTATGMFMGTPGYLSPEQCLDEDIDARTDIYSLGVTFYEMLTGVTPFKADSPLALLRQIIEVEPRDVGELRPDVPEAVRTVLRKMMAKNREDRYAECGELVADLQAWLETSGGESTDLGAIVAAVVAGSSTRAGAVETNPAAVGSIEALNTDPTMRVDSAEVAAASSPPPPIPPGQVPPPPPAAGEPEPELVEAPVPDEDGSSGGSRWILGLAIAGILLLALGAAAGYGAWKMGALDGLMRLAGISKGEAGQVASNNEDSQVDPAAAGMENSTTRGEVESAETSPAEGEDEFDALEAKARKTGTEDGTTGSPGSGDGSVPRPAATTSAGSSASSGSSEPVPAEKTEKSAPAAAVGGTASSSGSSQPVKTRPTEVPVGTGIAVVAVGEPLLAGAASDFLIQTLGRGGVETFDGLTVPGVAGALEGQEGSDLIDLLRPYARYLIVVRAEYTGDRELNYMGRYDREFQARLHVVAQDLLDGHMLGPGIHGPIGYTAMTVDRKVSDMLRPKLRRIREIVSRRGN